MQKLIFFLLLIISVYAGCSSQIKHNTASRAKVVEVLNDQTAVISKFRGEANAGDPLIIYQLKCSGDHRESDCVERKVGQGKITRFINQDTAQIEFTSGSKISRGSRIKILR